AIETKTTALMRYSRRLVRVPCLPVGDGVAACCRYVRMPLLPAVNSCLRSAHGWRRICCHVLDAVPAVSWLVQSRLRRISRATSVVRAGACPAYRATGCEWLLPASGSHPHLCQARHTPGLCW